MSSRTWTILIGIFVVFALAGWFLWQTSSSGTSDAPSRSATPFKVGAILPLSGSAASVGEFQRNGLLAAAERINATGGVRGRPLEVIFADSRNEGRTGLDVFQRMTAVDSPPVVIASHSGVCVPLASHMATTDRQDVVLFTTVTSAPGVPQMSDYVFRHFVTCQNEATTMSQFASHELGLSKTAVFYINDDFGLGGLEAFRESFRAQGGAMVAADSYEKSGTDFRGSLTKLVSGQPEAVYVIGYDKAFAIAVKQLREIGYEGTILTSIGMSVPSWRTLAGDAAEGIFLTASYFDPSSDDPETRTFVELYRKMADQDPTESTPNFQAAFLYDSLHMIAEVVSDSGPQVSDIRDALVRVEAFPGVVGTAGFDDQGEADMPLRVMRVTGGRLVPVARNGKARN